MVCCTQTWDSFCVQESQSLCGAMCGQCAQNGQMCATGANCCSGTCVGGICQNACQPDGGPCMNFQDCCSGVCAQGKCGTQCKQDGTGCMLGSECCSGSCNAGTCGNQACPSDGSTCGNCVASSCCSQLLGCFQNPSCINNVTCFLQCITGGGGGPIQCLTQCVNSPQAFQLLICLGTNCGPGTCF
jgi:hypothetical protein